MSKGKKNEEQNLPDLEQEKRLGTLQMKILILLWNREMYGLEIQKHLELKGLRTKTSQLYPALDKLAQMGALEKRTVHKIGADRKFYWTSQYGKNLILKYISDFMEDLAEIQFEKFGEWTPFILEMISIEPGMVVVDFSIREIESLLVHLAPMVSRTGRYFLVAHKEETTELLKERIEHYQLEDYVNVLKRKKEVVELGDNSSDLVFAFVTLHEDRSDWVLKDMARILKKGGKAVIIDMEHIENHMLIDILVHFAIAHSRTGLILKDFKKEAQVLGFEIEKIEKREGLLFILLQKK